MKGLPLVRRSLWQHRRIHVAVALGTLAATAVFAGALLIGDSVRGSLRGLTLDRLGRIDEILAGDHFFRSDLASELAAEPEFKQHFNAAVPVILFPAASVQTERSSPLSHDAGQSPESSANGKRLAAGVQVLGVTPEFWGLAAAANRPAFSPSSGEVIVNQPLADELQLRTGDRVIVRFGKADQIPADSPLGRRTDRTATLAELKVAQIIPAAGLGRFGLSPSQLTPLTAYVALGDVQQALDVSGKANMVLIAGRDALHPASAEASQALPQWLRPTLADYGLALKHVRLTFGAGESQETIYDYFNLTSERMVFDEKAEAAVLRALGGFRQDRVLTYLANRIEKAADASSGDNPKSSPQSVIPYSTIAAVESFAGQELGENEIALTSWAADDLKAGIGDRIRLTYFEPETIHGEEVERTAEFLVKQVIPLTEPQAGFTRREPAIYKDRPTVANDPDLTPEVKGITDQASIADWDAPFPFDYKLIRPQDDTYWENHRTTPKAYVSLATGQRLWGSRFGRLTSVRIPAATGVSAEAIERTIVSKLRASGEHLGLTFAPIKRQGLAASAGTTPFDGLFLALSMFLIASALILVWLLFRLGIEQRASEIGLFAALGWPSRRIGRLFLVEGAAVAAAGAALGVLGGIGYAWLMLVGLRTWWVGAIATPFLTLFITPQSLLAGFALGVLASVATMAISLRQLRRASTSRLLAGEIVPVARRGAPHDGRQKGRLGFILAWISIGGAIALVAYAAQLGGEAQAGALLGAGALLLAGLVLLFVHRLRRGGQASSLLGNGALARLAFRSAARNIGRSAATVALVATATFLIVAVSAFRMQPTEQGVGGFQLLAESAQPIYEDLNSAAGREQLLADRAAALEGATVLSLRLREGDDASCRNLYQPAQPRVLGVPQQMIDYFDDQELPARFSWSVSAAKSPAEQANPWRLLRSPAANDQPIPVVLDQNTAMYSLRLYHGVGEIFPVTYPGRAPVKFQVAGLLGGSVLQGSLLIGEADFQRLFPQVSGYRFFLIRASGDENRIAAVLEDRLSDEGFDCVSAKARLADLLAVQNTYIRTFQSLGALGLVLGTFGLAAVQLRSIFERRKELALLRAAGFRDARLGQLVLLENLVLLLTGLVLGTVSALFAILPQIVLGGASVPFADLSVLLLAVLAAGLVAASLAVRATLRAPLVPALRGD